MARHPLSTRFQAPLRLFTVLSMVLALFAPFAQTATTYAASVSAAVFTGGAGTVSVGGTLYAKSGGALTLSVTTDSSARCVDVGGFATRQTSTTSKTSWTFTGTASTGDGVKPYTITVGEGSNANACTTRTATTSASYTLDNTGPVVTTTKTPSPNGAGWNNSNVSWTWAAIDAGSGVASGPTPATGSATANYTNQDFVSTAADRLGNSATGTVTVMLDKAAPTISGTRTPAANANGWNNTDVTVSFTCADQNPGSGIKSCTGATTTLTNSGVNQVVNGTATDNADNSTPLSVGPINIDKVAPTLSGAPTTSPNAAGWYKSDAVIAWTAGDTLSGLVAVPANSTITGEGSSLTASASVSDKAGNTTTALSPAVKIDRTAPKTTAAAPPAWNNSDVTLSLNAEDALSGVSATYFKLDGGAQQSGTSATINAEGVHTLQFWSVDNAGNSEAVQTVMVKIDKTAPTISHTQSPSANANGWNNANVTVSFVCNDSLSGIASCTAPQTITGEGKNQAVTGTARDNAGNTASDPATVSIDKSAPTISGTRTPAANANGWNNTPVIVTFSCADGLSGTDACPSAQTKGEGANQSASGSVVDAAGNSASATVSGINVDLTDPTLSGTATTAPNASGWYNADVVIAWTCADNLSSIDGSCPANSTISGEGASLAAAQSLSDKAGNQTTKTVGGIKIDRTRPSTAASAPLGWQSSDIVVSFEATDNLSGVNATYFKVDGGAQQSGNQVTIGSDGTHTIQYASIDDAGNAEAWQSVTVQLDKQSPTISADQAPVANANGWNNTNVTVTFTCADQATLSGLASCTAPQTITTEGKHQPVVGTASDNAGNSAQAPTAVNIDKSAPTISATANRTANANGWYRDNVTVSFTCGDALSGIDTCAEAQTLGEGANQSASGSAIDAADNTASTSINGINVDTTAPTLSAAPTTLPNADGWYKSDVTMTWNCGDALSGLAGSCPADNVISGEGDDLYVSALIADKAGNTATSDSPTVKIDRNAPSTDVFAPSEWVNNSVTVELSASDALSGVEATYYTLDNGAQQSGTSLLISSEGMHTLKFWSVDQAGNAEAPKTAQINVDKSAPTIDHTQSPNANANGWNNSNVTVTFTCADADSGVKRCTAPQTVTGEGKDQLVTGTAEDNAGNKQTDNASVSIDKTAPTISAQADRAANANSWYRDDVTVKFTCADNGGGSGIDQCAATQTLVEGADQSVSGTASDAAGNTASTSIDGINVDKTAPTLSGAPTTQSNAAGWYNNSIAIKWICADALAGIDGSCPANSTIAGEGENLTTSASVSDKAGNVINAASTPINVDKTAPSTSANAPAGWNNNNVTVSLDAFDALSGIKTTYFKLDGGAQQSGISVAISSEGVHTLQFWSVDNAGNSEAAQTVTVKIDKTAPQVSASQAPAANANGWNNADVKVSFTCADTISGMASCPAPQTITSEGKAQPVSGTAVDNAGNSTTEVAGVSIDKSAPTIVGTSSPAANVFGWNNSDVTVSFTCDDALSGIDSCPAARTLAEGANQSASGTTTDSAGNTASTSINGINVDTTAPTLSGAPTTQPNAAGWYNDDVTIRWTATDALSGIDPATVPTDSTISGEGTSLNASAMVSDKAGNEKAAVTAPIKLDRTAPSTKVSAPSEWVNDYVTLTLDADDNLSGVRATAFKLDNGAQQSGTSVAITSEGMHTVQFWSVDNAGNVENVKSVQVKIDLSSPTIEHTLSPLPNSLGWNNTNVTVTFTCADTNGIQSCTAPQTVTSEGKDQPVIGTAVDVAGNKQTDPALVSIDKTAPTISTKADRAANANGWYRDDVTVKFTCEDTISGIYSCPAAKTLGEGANQIVSGKASDAAGNLSAEAFHTTINVDKTDPTISGATTAANANGWYNGDVSIKWSCADVLSGINGNCPANTTLTGEGENLSASASVSDKAGNSASTTVSGIKIDRNAPATQAIAPEGWQKTNIAISLSARDALSGVQATVYKVDGGAQQSGSSLLISSDGIHTVQFWSVDKAGNAEVPQTITVRLDKTIPTISGAATTSPNANGWYKSDVTVKWTCADALSGLASCSPETTLTSDGANQSVKGDASDNAGNTATATVSGINLDKTAPEVTIKGIASGGVYTLGAVPAASCSATDGLSGVAGTCSGTRSGGTTNGVGSFTYTATATDKAGNTRTETARYKVVYGYGTTFFLQPINDTAHQTGVSTSVFKAGSTVPVKFQIKKADGTIVQANSAPQWLTPARGSSTSAAVDESVYSDAATSGTTFKWDATAQQYIYNWNTKGVAAGFYYRIGVTLDDGQTYFVNIGLR